MSLTRYVFTGGRSFVADNEKVVDEMIMLQLGLDNPEIWVWPVEFIHGGATGFDQFIDKQLRLAGWPDESIITLRPQYDRFVPEQKALAPLIRNVEMIEWAQEATYSAVIGCLWHEVDIAQRGSGTAHCLREGIKRGLDAHIIRYREPSTRVIH